MKWSNIYNKDNHVCISEVCYTHNLLSFTTSPAEAANICVTGIKYEEASVFKNPFHIFIGDKKGSSWNSKTNQSLGSLNIHANCEYVSQKKKLQLNYETIKI